MFVVTYNSLEIWAPVIGNLQVAMYMLALGPIFPNNGNHHFTATGI